MFQPVPRTFLFWYVFPKKFHVGAGIFVSITQISVAVRHGLPMGTWFFRFTNTFWRVATFLDVFYHLDMAPHFDMVTVDHRYENRTNCDRRSLGICSESFYKHISFAGLVHNQPPFLSLDEEQMCLAKLDKFMVDVLLPLAASTQAVHWIYHAILVEISRYLRHSDPFWGLMMVVHNPNHKASFGCIFSPKFSITSTARSNSMTTLWLGFHLVQTS